jgi:hypothetical protein
MSDPRSIRCVETVERFADGGCTLFELADARLQADLAERSANGNSARRASRAATLSAAPYTDTYLTNVIGSVLSAVHNRQEQQAQCSLLRDIFGNPFRPVAFDPAWRTSAAVALASRMYESRDFAPMPILADALQDAGCENDDILDHCRERGVHVRGCWVVDLVLGKA